MLSSDAETTGPARRAARSPADAHKTTWLVLADRGPALECGRLAGETARLVPSPAALEGELARLRPRLVIVAAPPGGAAEIALVATERRRRPSLRAVLVNPPAGTEQRLSALADGFDDAVPSSLSAAELLGRARLLAAPRSRPTGLLAIGDGIELDLVAQDLRRDGVSVHLRPKELGLLALLAAHSGRVYTRRQLLDRVWGQGVESDPRTVDVHVRWLRSKIEVDPEHPARLVTVRGIGYRLDIGDR